MNIQQITEFFMWCTIVNGLGYAVTAGFCVFGRDFIYGMQKKMFNVPRETFDVIIYGYVGLYKLLFIVFNVVPFIALKIVG